MELRILGCGTILPEKEGRNCSGYVVDKNILLDCGTGIWRALVNNDIPHGSLTAIIITHYHPDHVSDLAPLLLTRWLTRGQYNQELILAGPADFTEWFNEFAKMQGSWLNDLAVTVIPLAGDPVEIAGYRVQSVKTEHTESSIAIRLEQDGTSLFYSGDTDYNTDIFDLITDVNLALIEASYPEEYKIDGHLTPALAGKIAARANAKSLVLTHLYPDARSQNPKDKAEQFFHGPVQVAEDDLVITI